MTQIKKLRELEDGEENENQEESSQEGYEEHYKAKKEEFKNVQKINPERMNDSEEYELVEVPTQTTTVIRHKRSQNMFDVNQSIVQILNKLSRIEKAVA